MSSELGEKPGPDHGSMLKLLRVVFLILLVVFTSLIIVRDSALPEGGISLERWWPLAVIGSLVFFAGIIALDVLTPKRKLSTISAIFVGLITGVIVAAIMGVVIDLFSNVYDFRDARLLEPFKILLGLGICYLTISTVMQTQDDFRLVIPYVEFAKRIRGVRPLLLDTSMLIDGRVLGIAETGLFQAPLIVPRAVIEELQRMSDSSDRLKRARGRRGLDMVTKLQRTPLVDLVIEESGPSMPGSVDQLLVELARTLPATILTSDAGLSRVASIHGVPAINLNELASALKTAAIPGEPLSVEITRRGEQAGQGVGYLDDGTMVVVEDGGDSIGRDVSVTVISSMQTSAGKLVFGRIYPVNNSEESARAQPTEESPLPEPEAAAIPEIAERAELPARPARPGPLGPARGDGASARSSRNPRR